MKGRRGKALWVAALAIAILFGLAYGFFSLLFHSAAPDPSPERPELDRAPEAAVQNETPLPEDSAPAPPVRATAGRPGGRPSARRPEEDPAVAAREIEAKRREFEETMRTAGLVKDATGEYIHPEEKRERDEIRERQKMAAAQGLVLHKGEWLTRREKQRRIFAEWMEAEGRSRDPETGTWHRPGEKPEGEAPPPSAPPPVQPPTISVDRLPASVEVEIAGFEWRTATSDRLVALGKTNLPDGFLLLVSVAPLLSPTTTLAWVRAPVASGRFEAVFESISREATRNGYLVAADWTAGLDLPPERKAEPVGELWVHGEAEELRGLVDAERKRLSDWISRLTELHGEYAARTDGEAWNPPVGWFDRLEQVEREVMAEFTSRLGGFAGAYHLTSARAAGELPRRLRLAADLALHPERENVFARHGTSDYVRLEALAADVEALPGGLEEDSRRMDGLLGEWEKKD